MSLRGGIDLGGTKIQAVLVDEQFVVLGDARVPTPTSGGPQDVADAMVEAMRQAAEGHGDPVAIGVGSPGVIDEKAGVVSSARNLPDWEGSFALAEALQDALGAPIAIGNDVNVATDAEFALGAAREFTSLLGVFWGTGVGGGIILDSKPWYGNGASGEIGHVVVEIGGSRCPCGRRGCMEAYAGRGAMEARARKLVDEGRKTALFEIMKERGRPRLTSGIWKRALERDDDLAHELIDRALRALGAGVASVVNVLDVDAVVIGGGLGLKLGEPYAERLRVAMMPHLFASERPPAIRLAALGDLGGATGAALLSRKLA